MQLRAVSLVAAAAFPGRRVTVGRGSVRKVLDRRHPAPFPVPAKVCAGAAGRCRRLPAVFIYQKQMMVVQILRATAKHGSLLSATVVGIKYSLANNSMSAVQWHSPGQHLQ